MKYLFLLNSAEDGPPAPGTPEGQQLFAEWAMAIGQMSAAGVLLDCAPLSGASTATTVQVRDGESMLSDGPAAEIREQVGGYALIECADLDDALKWAAIIPTAKTGSVELRAVIDTGRP
jgi:hypothetical protein